MLMLANTSLLLYGITTSLILLFHTLYLSANAIGIKYIVSQYKGCSLKQICSSPKDHVKGSQRLLVTCHTGLWLLNITPQWWGGLDMLDLPWQPLKEGLAQLFALHFWLCHFLQNSTPKQAEVQVMCVVHVGRPIENFQEKFLLLPEVIFHTGKENVKKLALGQSHGYLHWHNRLFIC